MKNTYNGWKISKRDGGDRFIKNNPSPELTEDEKKDLKQKIIEHHKSFGLPEDLKKELYPELFG